MSILININEKFNETNMEHRKFDSCEPYWNPDLDRCYYSYECSMYEWSWIALCLYDWKWWIWWLWHCSCYWPRDNYDWKHICTLTFEEALQATRWSESIKDSIRKDWL